MDNQWTQWRRDNGQGRWTLVAHLAIGVGAVLLGITPDRAWALDSWNIGLHKSGTYHAGSDPVMFVAAHFRGSFTFKNVSTALHDYVKSNRQRNKTAVRSHDAKNQSFRLANDRHAVLGWKNLRSGAYFYVGVRIKPSGTSYEWITCRTKTGSGGKDGQAWWFKTNGYKVWVHFADDDHGGILWRFSGPS